MEGGGIDCTSAPSRSGPDLRRSEGGRGGAQGPRPPARRVGPPNLSPLPLPPLFGLRRLLGPRARGERTSRRGAGPAGWGAGRRVQSRPPLALALRPPLGSAAEWRAIGAPIGSLRGYSRAAAPVPHRVGRALASPVLRRVYGAESSAAAAAQPAAPPARLPFGPIKAA
eukprot:scaffold2552_cov380-Prasinococcus_capsulatus_cf.AAC.39